MKKIYKIFVIAIAILFLFYPFCFGAEDDIELKKHIKQEDGSLFEKIIAEAVWTKWITESECSLHKQTTFLIKIPCTILILFPN